MLKLQNYGHWTATKVEKSLPQHTDAGLEIVYVANGSVEWDYQGTSILASSGDLTFSWPWQTHGARDNRVPSVELYYILLPLKTEKGTPRFRDGLGMTTTEGNRIIQQLLNHPPILSVSAQSGKYMAHLMKHLEQHDGNLNLDAKGLLLLLLSEIEKALEKERTADTRKREALQQVKAFWQEYLPENLTKAWSLNEMCAHLGIGRTAFTTQTKALCGDTPMRQLTRLRLDQADQLLKTGKLSITEVAHRVGFSSSQYFATVYKSYKTHPPSMVLSASDTDSIKK